LQNNRGEPAVCIDEKEEAKEGHLRSHNWFDAIAPVFSKRAQAIDLRHEQLAMKAGTGASDNSRNLL